jgi:hypothetical protein
MPRPQSLLHRLNGGEILRAFGATILIVNTNSDDSQSRIFAM